MVDLGVSVRRLVVAVGFGDVDSDDEQSIAGGEGREICPWRCHR